MRDIEVDREMVFRSIVDAYWTARGLWADHKQALAAAAELARGFAARLVEGHPVPYSATVWLGEESLGYVGEAIEGGAQYHRRP